MYGLDIDFGGDKLYRIDEYIVQPPRRGYPYPNTTVKNGITYFSYNLENTNKSQACGCVKYEETTGEMSHTRYLVYGIVGLAVNSTEDTVQPVLGFCVME